MRRFAAPFMFASCILAIASIFAPLVFCTTGEGAGQVFMVCLYAAGACAAGYAVCEDA